MINSVDSDALRFKLDSLRTHFPMLVDQVVEMPIRRFWLHDGFASPSARISADYGVPPAKRAVRAPSVRGTRLNSSTQAFVDYVDARHPAGGICVPRVVISRADTLGRRVVNEDALMATLGPLGFRRVVLSELDHADQVSLFRNAEVIVAPHGAGLANLIFCRPGTRVFELTNRQFLRHAISFLDISKLRRLRHRLIAVDQRVPGGGVVGAPGNDMHLSVEAIAYLEAAVQES